MKHKKLRLIKIVDELMNYFYSIGATDIDINIKEEFDCYIIKLKSNYSSKSKDSVANRLKCLNCEKQEEMEEYYWALTGVSDVDTELTLVGMMTDKAEMNISDDTIDLVLFKYKK